MSEFCTHTRKFLEDAGLAPEELTGLEHPPIHVLPTLKGYGLWGSTGVGKSWALVPVAGRILDRRVRWLLDPTPATVPDLRNLLFWVSWPEAARVLKDRAFGSAASKDQNRAWVERCKNTGNLFLDDLGREQSRGEEDYAYGALSEIIVHRFRFDKPIYWTSNVSPDDLLELYKSRLGSRLLGKWPPFQVDGPDLRLNPELLPPPVEGAEVRDGRALAAGGAA